MTRIFLAAGVVALAISAPAGAKPEGKGRDSAQTERGGGKSRTQRAERSGGRETVRSETRQMRSSQERPQRMAQRQEARERPQRVEHQKQRIERRAERPQRVDRQEQRVERRAERPQRVERQEHRVANRVDRQAVRDDRIANRVERRDVVRVRDLDDDRFNPRFGQQGMARGLIDGCPPGLAKKGNGCMPPGQAKKLVGTVIPATYRERLVPIGLRDIYRDTDDYYWRYGDGYAYRVNRSDNLIAGLLPLMGLGYTIGQPFPASYMNSYVPSYYQPFYQNSGDDYYRYANGYIYEIDGRTGLIEDIDPAYGYGYGVGQLWPSSYDYYNVPLAYRDMYYDTPDYYYRYAPGSIYQVDRSSNLITAVASLLTGGLTVGQPLPVGYGAYNVPYAYRSTYYDTPDAWYRYNNGYIYQVDPTTQLVTALVRALV